MTRSALLTLLIPAGFGAILLTIAVVARTGVLARENPGHPINSAMREAMAAKSPQWTTEQAQILAEKYAGAHETKSGVRFVIRHPGTGEAKPQEGQIVSLHYSLTLLDGTPVESTAHGEPFNFVVGSGVVIQGWDDVVRTMRREERRTVVIPWWLAYGEKGLRNRVPPRAAVVLDLELLDFGGVGPEQ